MKIRAYAKLNLHLAVGMKRADGYHDIFSIMEKISLWDTLHIEPLDLNGLELTVLPNEFDVSAGQDNTIYHAYELFCEAIGEPIGLEVTLEKRIPSQSGLGGGSSDAAALLLYLNNAAQNKLSPQRLRKIAAAVGSDVPFFLEDDGAVVRGRGERTEAVQIVPHHWAVVLVPNFGISTHWAYENLTLDLTKNSNECKFEKLYSTRRVDIVESAGNFDNSFRGLLECAYSFYRSAAKKLVNMGAVAALPSGSGSALFGLFVEQDAARRAIAKPWAVRYKFLVEPVGVVEPR